MAWSATLPRSFPTASVTNPSLLPIGLHGLHPFLYPYLYLCPLSCNIHFTLKMVSEWSSEMFVSYQIITSIINQKTISWISRICYRMKSTETISCNSFQWKRQEWFQTNRQVNSTSNNFNINYTMYSIYNAGYYVILSAMIFCHCQADELYMFWPVCTYV